MKFIKKAMINVEGVFDFFRSRYNDGFRLAATGLMGSIAGMFALLAIENDNSPAENFIEEHGGYSQDYILGDFPSACDLDDEPFYLAKKGPNGRYALYAGSEGYYYAKTVGEAEDFADLLEVCSDELEVNSKGVGAIEYEIRDWVSNPIKLIDDEDGSVKHVLHLKDSNDDRRLNMATHMVENGLNSRAEALKDVWGDAIRDFSRGKAYDVINDDTLKTLHHNGDYRDGMGFLSVLGLLGTYMAAGAVGGMALSGAFASPNAAARARKQKRDERRAALNRNDLDF